MIWIFPTYQDDHAEYTGGKPGHIPTCTTHPVYKLSLVISLTEKKVRMKTILKHIERHEFENYLIN